MLAAAFLAAAQPARAQWIVHDPTSYASLIRQAQTALEQLQQLKAQVEEARRLYEGFANASGAGAYAPSLHATGLRAFLPRLADWRSAADGDLEALGDIGRRAREIREAGRLHQAPAGDPAGQDLERAGDRAARDAALGEAAAQAGAQRLQGLAELGARLDQAGSARAVMDLQARLAAEQAMAVNDQMRLQGLAMAQAAEERLRAQRDRERAKAAAEARLVALRSGFR
jgi:type IV secretion system protein VirB5